MVDSSSRRTAHVVNYTRPEERREQIHTAWCPGSRNQLLKNCLLIVSPEYYGVATPAGYQEATSERRQAGVELALELHKIDTAQVRN